MLQTHFMTDFSNFSLLLSHSLIVIMVLKFMTQSQANVGLPEKEPKKRVLTS